MLFRIFAILPVSLCLANTAVASPLDRLPGFDGLLFETGNVVSMSGIAVDPMLSGRLSLQPVLVSGDIAPFFLSGQIGVKYDLGSGTHLALTFGTAWGLDTDFPQGTGFPLAGFNLSAEARRASIIFRQEIGKQWDVIIGMNVENLQGDAQIALGPVSYSAQFESSHATGFLAGFAWSRPESATTLRLTYESAIRHAATTKEELPGRLTAVSELRVSYPQSVSLQAQTGIAKDTVVIASIRWSDWSSFGFSPELASSLTGPFLSGNHDTLSYTLGVGARLNRTWSGAILVSHMDEGGSPGFLMPSAGRNSITLALRHETERRILGLGLQYTKLQDAETQVPTLFGPTPAEFSDNTALAVVAELRLRF